MSEVRVGGEDLGAMAPSLSVRMARTTLAPARARQALRSVLTAIGVGTDAQHEPLTVISELVTNFVSSGSGGDILATGYVERGMLHLEVTTEPHERHAACFDPSSAVTWLGTAVVMSWCDELAVRKDEHGLRRVTCTLRVRAKGDPPCAGRTGGPIARFPSAEAADDA